MAQLPLPREPIHKPTISFDRDAVAVYVTVPIPLRELDRDEADITKAASRRAEDALLSEGYRNFELCNVSLKSSQDGMETIGCVCFNCAASRGSRFTATVYVSFKPEEVEEEVELINTPRVEA